MKMQELQKLWQKGKIEKRVYWTLMREEYMKILPQLQSVLSNSNECQNIIISQNACILEKRNGVKLFFDFAQPICRAEADLIMNEDPEKESMEYVEKYLIENPCKTILDIGANEGMFSLDLYKSNQSLIYHVFEPLPATYEKLVATAELNGVDYKKYVTHNIGLSNKEGIFDFYMPGASEAASLRPIDDDFYLKESNDMGDYTGKNKIEKVRCNVDTVDNFVEINNVDSIGFVKIDVEGNEKFVLEGAIKTLKKYKPMVYCELLRKHAKRFGYHPNEVIEFMKEMGYNCETLRNGKVVIVEKIDEETMETNFFFVHNEK